MQTKHFLTFGKILILRMRPADMQSVLTALRISSSGSSSGRPFKYTAFCIFVVLLADMMCVGVVGGLGFFRKKKKKKKQKGDLDCYELIKLGKNLRRLK